MLTHKELKKKALKDPTVKAEYKSLKEGFDLLDRLLKLLDMNTLPIIQSSYPSCPYSYKAAHNGQSVHQTTPEPGQ